MLKRAMLAASLMMTFGAIAATGFALAQDNVQPSTDEVPHFRAKQVIGAKVAVDGANSVGKVDDIVLDANGNVDYLIVALANDKLVTVPWDATKFNVEKQMATVQIPQEQFQQVPTYTARQYPVWTPAYRTQIYHSYGLTPGQQRRAIRRGAVVVP